MRPLISVVRIVGASWLVLLFSLVHCTGQTQYSEDGVLSGNEEESRWFVNLARYSPVREAARLGVTNPMPSGPIGPLAPNMKAVTVSRKHSEDLALSGTFEHTSPTGSIYYTVGFEAWDRLDAEGYSWDVVGENLTGYEATGESAHDVLFNSPSHRDNILDPVFLEIGVGYHYDAVSVFTHYFTQVFATRDSSLEHFFTGTVFFDNDSNGFYGAAEGIGGIGVRLSTAGGPHGMYDVSASNGNFAIPIGSIPDNETVDVAFENLTGSDVTMTVPIGFGTMARFEVSNAVVRSYGTFIQPVGRVNVGFRNVAPHMGRLSASFSGSSVQVSMPALIGAGYRAQYSSNLLVGDWISFETGTATVELVNFADSGGPDRPSPYEADRRFYRIVLDED